MPSKEFYRQEQGHMCKHLLTLCIHNCFICHKLTCTFLIPVFVFAAGRDNQVALAGKSGEATSSCQDVGVAFGQPWLQGPN